MHKVYLKRDTSTEHGKAMEKTYNPALPWYVQISPNFPEIYLSYIRASLTRDFPEYADAIGEITHVEGGVSVSFEDPEKAMLFKLANGSEIPK